MKKNDIKIFGEASVGHIEKRGFFSYVAVRDCDKAALNSSLVNVICFTSINDCFC